MQCCKHTLAVATCIFAVAMPVFAQPASLAGMPARSTGTTSYRPAFDGYRPFKDQPVGSWRENNDLVGRIGGWKAYAREGQATDTHKGDVAADPATAPAAPKAAPNGPSQQREQ